VDYYSLHGRKGEHDPSYVNRGREISGGDLERSKLSAKGGEEELGDLVKKCRSGNVRMLVETASSDGGNTGASGIQKKGGRTTDWSLGGRDGEGGTRRKCQRALYMGKAEAAGGEAR